MVISIDPLAGYFASIYLPAGTLQMYNSAGYELCKIRKKLINIIYIMLNSIRNIFGFIQGGIVIRFAYKTAQTHLLTGPK